MRLELVLFCGVISFAFLCNGVLFADPFSVCMGLVYYLPFWDCCRTRAKARRFGKTK